MAMAQSSVAAGARASRLRAACLRARRRGWPPCHHRLRLSLRTCRTRWLNAGRNRADVCRETHRQGRTRPWMQPSRQAGAWPSAAAEPPGRSAPDIRHTDGLGRTAREGARPGRRSPCRQRGTASPAGAATFGYPTPILHFRRVTLLHPQNSLPSRALCSAEHMPMPEVSLEQGGGTWKAAIGCPNCVRCAAYERAASSAAWPPPTLQAAMLTRPPSTAPRQRGVSRRHHMLHAHAQRPRPGQAAACRPLQHGE